jgi:hypothetical protein
LSAAAHSSLSLPHRHTTAAAIRKITKKPEEIGHDTLNIVHFLAFLPNPPFEDLEHQFNST